MTANELNEKALDILDRISGLIVEFQGIRDEADDEAWHAASMARTFLDKLCDIEYTIEA